MKGTTPPLVYVAIVIVGLATILFGVTNTSGPSCGIPGMWKCLPGVVAAGRALAISVGTFFAAVGTLNLSGARRPAATAITIVAGTIGLAIAGWFAYAVATGAIPLSDPFSVAWTLGLTVWHTYAGIIFFAAALSDRVLDRLRR
jgi:hypothetical protein